MARDDVNVIVYKILKYLYECKKMGYHPRVEDITWNANLLQIPEIYWIVERQGRNGASFNDKKTIEAKAGYVDKRNREDMMNCDTLTYDQHAALATLAGARHELHTHSERLFDTNIEQSTVIG